MKRTVSFLLINLIIVMLLAGCQQVAPVMPNSEPVSNGFIPAKAGNYDSADTAIVVDINTAECKITFKTTYIGKKYTLYYDGATVFEDKYGTGMSVKQLKCGDMVDVRFIKAWKRLDYLKLTEGQFAFTNTVDYQFSFDGKHVMIAGQQYSLDDNLAVIAENGTGELMDINPVDELSFIGYDHRIYSIIIERGHGYLRLKNDSYFVGGWIEVGQRQIRQIEEDMILAVPVGTYPVTVSNLGSSGQETITIENGKEYELDVSGWQAEAKFGDIIFSTTPANARLYIDGNVIDKDQPVNLEYGIHQMIAVADGYQTISKYIKVASDSANLDIVMEPKEKGVSANNPDDYVEPIINPYVPSTNAVSFNIINPPESTSVNRTDSTSANSTNTLSSSGNYKVYIDSPEGAEVYVDGAYVGISPVSFNKKEGMIVVILRKNGYETRSYTINLDSEKKDVNYSFSELQKLE